MKAAITERLGELGAQITPVTGAGFVEQWNGIRFGHPLYIEDWDVYGIDQYYTDHRDVYHTDRALFYDNLVAHYFSDHELPYGQDFYRNWLFTPFKAGSKDFGELDGLVEEEQLRETIAGTELDFICIFHAYGYPDHFFVCLTDPQPDNPTVYSTDHEQFFSELENEGPLEDFLKRYMTKAQFREVVEDYLDAKVGKS